MTEKPKKPLDATSVNPRYEGLTRGGMAQLLTPAQEPGGAGGAGVWQGHDTDTQGVAITWARGGTGTSGNADFILGRLSALLDEFILGYQAACDPSV